MKKSDSKWSKHDMNFSLIEVFNKDITIQMNNSESKTEKENWGGSLVDVIRNKISNKWVSDTDSIKTCHVGK